jgi:hypothetical protein
MPDPTRFVGNSIEELLVALADGVREAQLALGDGPLVDDNGRPIASYQLPYLDFTINIAINTQRDEGGRPIVLLSGGGGRSSTGTQVMSQISGRLVAIPPGDGLPLPRITLALAKRDGDKVRIVVEVSNTAGERLAAQPLELNLDDAESALLSKANGLADYKRDLGRTRLNDAVLVTDEKGRAEAGFTISDAEDPQAIFVVVATIGQYRSRLAIPVKELS